jgi:hypothetical protein
LTWATKTGSTQWQRFITAGVIPWPHLSRLFSGKYYLKLSLGRADLQNINTSSAF